MYTLFSNHHNVSYLQKQNILIKHQATKYFSLFKILLPTLILKTYDTKEIFDFSTKYNSSYENFKFADISKYKNIDANISVKKLSLILFHRLNAFSNLKKKCDEADAMDVDLLKKVNIKKVCVKNFNRLCNNMMMSSFDTDIFKFLIL